MSIKLSGNGLWESSRIIVPEFREALIRNRIDLEKRERIDLEESERERIALSLVESLENQCSITLHLFDPYKDKIVTGIVERIDPLQQRLRIDGEWIKFIDIESCL